MATRRDVEAAGAALGASVSAVVWEGPALAVRRKEPLREMRSKSCMPTWTPAPLRKREGIE